MITVAPDAWNQVADGDIKLDLLSIILDSAQMPTTLIGDAPVEVSAMQSKILYVLIANLEQICPIKVLHEVATNRPYEGNPSVVRTHMNHLRTKLPDPYSDRIMTVRKKGFLMLRTKPVVAIA